MVRLLHSVYDQMALSSDLFRVESDRLQSVRPLWKDEIDTKILKYMPERDLRKCSALNV